MLYNSLNSLRNPSFLCCLKKYFSSNLQLDLRICEHRSAVYVEIHEHLSAATTTRKWHFAKALILMYGIFWLVSCQNSFLLKKPLTDFSPRYFNEISLRQNQPFKSENSQAFGFLPLYKNILGKLFFSHCKNLPSDSAYLEMILNQNCSSQSFAVLMTINRLLREHDLTIVHDHLPIFHHGRLRWIDYPSQCKK